MKQNVPFGAMLFADFFLRSSFFKMVLLAILFFSINLRSAANSYLFPEFLKASDYPIQDATVSGKVTDEGGEPLPGVNVIVKGTTTGATTDAGGAYSIRVSEPNATIVFSFVGYAPMEVQVNNRSTINVSLSPDVQSLSEVVVMGYNTQQKRDVTGSVVKIDEAELKTVPSNNFAQQLQGRAAGVTVLNDNSPNGGVAVRIRGVGSVTGYNDPLYVIDGVPTLGNLNQLNPNDVESMQVLKDASAASIYGARANNGVIVITTKKGKAGTTKVNFSMYEGIQDPGKGPDLLNSQQWVDIQWADKKSRGQIDPNTGLPLTPDIIFGGGTTGVIPDYIYSNRGGIMEGDPLTLPTPLDYYGTYKTPGFNSTKFLIYEPDKVGTDWYDVIFHTAPIRNYNLGISGGTENGRFAISADYYQQTGTLIHTDFKRYSIRANTEFSIKGKVRFGENLAVSYGDNVGYPQARTEFSPIITYRTVPIQPLYDIAGNPIGHRVGEDNGYIDAVRNKDNHGYTTLIFGNFYGEADILKHITARSSIGFDYKTFNRQAFVEPADESDFKNQNAQITVNSDYGINLTWTNTLNYQQTFGEHSIQVLAGTEAINYKYRDIYVTKNTFAFNDPSYRFLSAATQNGVSNGAGTDASLFSLFGKIDYKFRDRYLLSATLRRDGSSRFAPSNRYGTFPSFSVGWILSEEAFLKSAEFINSLKLRAGYGTTGNQEIDPYNQYTTYATSVVTSSYPLTGADNSVLAGFEARRLGNSSAQWEEQSMLNIGLDITLFNKLDFTAEWYDRQTSKLLLQTPIPGTQGQNGVPSSNVGEIKNTGIDLSLNYHGSSGTGFTYSIGVNWSSYRNEVTKLYDATNPFIQGLSISRNQVFTRTQVGHPISAFFGLVNEGVFHSQEEADDHATQFGDRGVFNQPGRLKFKDVNGDGNVDAGDYTFIGNPHPDFSYGINLSAGYKGFDMTVFLIGVSGNDIYNFQRQTLDMMGFGSNKSTRILGYWTPENPNSNVPVPNTDAAAQELRTSTYFIEDGSYVRAKNVQLGYTFPASLRSKLKVDNLRLYVQTSNLFTITDYKGMDPEVNLQDYGRGGQDIDRGVDRGPFPAPKIFMVGLQLGF